MDAIFLSGWEYNRLLAENPFASVQSSLPAEVFWNGAAQFWLFEKAWCTRESYAGEESAAKLGWATSEFCIRLQDEGWLATVDWAEEARASPSLAAGIASVWGQLRESHGGQIRQLLEQGRSVELEAIKARLLAPLLQHLGCLEDVTPSSVGYWIEPSGDAHGSRADVADLTTQALRDLADPISRHRMVLRSGFTLCRPPGTGVSPRERALQRAAEMKDQKPFIPSLLAGDLPQREYEEQLRPSVESRVYEPINRQLRSNFLDNFDRLRRLRDVAARWLWPDLHREWLPQLKDRPSVFLPEFKQRLGRALLRIEFDPYLERAADTAIKCVGYLAGSAAGGAIAAAGAGLPIAAGGGIVAAAAVEAHLAAHHRQWRASSDSFVVFYQKARDVLERAA